MEDVIDALSRIENVAASASAPALQRLVDLTELLVRSAPDDAHEFGRALRLKLNHLATLQQTVIEPIDGECFLAPSLVLPETTFASLH